MISYSYTVVPIVDLVVPTRTWVVVSLFVFSAVVTNVLVTFFAVVVVIGTLLVERGAGVVPCNAFLVEPTGTKAEVVGIFVVARARGMAILVDDSVLPLVVASIPRVVTFVLVLSPVSTEVVFVVVMGGVVVMFVEVVEAALVIEPSMAGVVVISLVFASVSEPSEVEPDIVVEAEAE